ncbi:MAG: hypothetical protein KGH98_01530 [Candidatus Micrarchaeota archaeon]|nr:hypothetical protein [Candidatus Micrarchaeota archaeon]
MAKNDVEALTREKVAAGGVLVRLYFDMRSDDKEKLQPTLLHLVNERLMKEQGVVYCYGAIEEPLKQENMYITSATVTVLFDSFFPLVNIAFNYAPAGVEILQPSKDMTLKIGDLQAMLMDLSGISVKYSKYILERVMKKEDLDMIDKDLKSREEIGRRLLEKKDGKEG